MKQLQHSPVVRRHPRAAMNIYANKIIGDEPHTTRVRDISESGVYLYKLLEPSEVEAPTVGLELQLPGRDEVIWALGEVVRNEDLDEPVDGVAVRFVRITDDDRQAIARYVTTRQTSVA